MDTSLTLDMLLQTFARYNTMLEPWNWLLLALATLATVLVFSRSASAGRVITGILGIIWLWVGVGFHMISFAPVFPLAYLMGALFVIQGLIFLFAARRNLLSFAWRADVYGVTGLLLALFSLIGYPATSYFAGAGYPQIPILGAPCPAVILTMGLLLLTSSRVPWSLLVIPLLWAFGAVAPIRAGMSSDWILLIGGVMAAAMIVYRDRRRVEQLSD